MINYYSKISGLHFELWKLLEVFVVNKLKYIILYFFLERSEWFLNIEVAETEGKCVWTAEVPNIDNSDTRVDLYPVSISQNLIYLYSELMLYTKYLEDPTPRQMQFVISQFMLTGMQTLTF